jgi:multimeric flavodoxin WrbA
MKTIAINGSPRKKWNTATLLQQALDGAKSKGSDTEIVHLYDVNFKGCTSCFSCKKKNSKHLGKCAMKDDLTPVLKAISECDVLLLGSPIYLGGVTGEMHSFLERLLFAPYSYDKENISFFKGKISSGFIYTMGIPADLKTLDAPEEYLKLLNYDAVFLRNQQFLQSLNGNSEILISNDTYQFDDYSKYHASRFDVEHKARMKAEQFPLDCQKAFDLGAGLAAISGS